MYRYDCAGSNLLIIGLRRVSSKKGTTSWVLDTPDFVNQYYMYGNHALRIQDGSGNAPEATSSETGKHY